MQTVAKSRDVPDDPLTAAVELGPIIAAAAAETERNRRVSPELLELLRGAGFFRMGLPNAVGGSEIELPTILGVLEEVARHDGSIGWITGIGCGTNFIATGMREEAVRKVFSPNPDIVTGGTWLTRGRADRVDGGYRVSGRWPFGSGSEHCSYLVGGCVLRDGDEVAPDDQGRPLTRIMLFPRADALIHDNWYVMGLRGTGSHDFEVADLFVPEEHSLELFTDRTAFSFALARMPILGMLASMLAAVMLGMARGATDTLSETVRTQSIGGSPLMDRPLTQFRIAEAEALVQSARAFVFHTATHMWELAAAGQPVPVRDDLRLRLASSHAARACSEAIQLVFTAGGTAALYHDSPLQRFQRDILAAQQHGMVAFYTYETLGRELLKEGLTVDAEVE